MRHLPGIGTILLAAAILMAGPAIGAVTETAVEAAADSVHGLPLAVLFFVDGQPHAGVAAPVADVRRFSLARATTLLAAQGRPVVTPDELTPLRRQWRVRSGLNVGEGFLAGCREDTGAEDLLLLTLLSRPDRLILMGRLISCADGHLVAVAIADGEAPQASPSESGWQAALAELMGRLIADVTTPPTVPDSDETIMILPASGVATNPDVDLAATHLYLAGLLAESRWQVIDPAIAVVALQEAGLQSRWLGADARHLLERRFGARRVILSELVSFDATRQDTPAALIIDEAPTPTLAIRDFLLSLRLVDLRTGGITASGQIYIDTSRRTGWFGRQFHRTLLQEIDAGSRELWREFLKDLEAS